MNKTIYVVFCVLLFVFGAAAGETIYEINVKYKEIKTREEIIGKWSFSEDWAGHMGFAIEFDKEEFKYWAYSDVKLIGDRAPVYPIKGKWKISDGILILAPDSSDEHLYATKLLMVEDGNSKGLLNPDNISIIMIHKKSINDRLFKKLTKEEEANLKWPLMNYPSKQK